jgi:WD40 repeat protein
MRILWLPFLLLSWTLQAQSLETVIQKGHELAVTSIAISPDSNFVATGSRDKSAKLWELRTGREVRSFLGHELTVTCLRFSPDGKLLITGSSDGTARIWETNTGKELHAVNPHKEIITDVAFTPDGKQYVVAGLKGLVTYYDLQSHQPLREMEMNAESNRTGAQFEISPDGKWLAFGEDNRLAKIFRTADWQLAYTLEYGSGWCGGCGTYMAFSPDSKNFFMASHHGSVKGYELGKGTLVHQFADEVNEP